jgi:hypothetical protein
MKLCRTSVDSCCLMCNLHECIVFCLPHYACHIAICICVCSLTTCECVFSMSSTSVPGVDERESIRLRYMDTAKHVIWPQVRPLYRRMPDRSRPSVCVCLSPHARLHYSDARGITHCAHTHSHGYRLHTRAHIMHTTGDGQLNAVCRRVTHECVECMGGCS